MSGMFFRTISVITSSFKRSSIKRSSLMLLAGTFQLPLAAAEGLVDPTGLRQATGAGVSVLALFGHHCTCLFALPLSLACPFGVFRPPVRNSRDALALSFSPELLPPTRMPYRVLPGVMPVALD